MNKSGESSESSSSSRTRMSGDDKLGVLEAEDDGDAPGIEIDDVRRAELEEAICPAGRKATADFEI